MKSLSLFLIFIICLCYINCHFLHLRPKAKKYRLEEECEYECQYGVCNEGECFCKAGYGGSNCSIKLTSDDFKFTTIQFFLALLGSALGGFLIGYAFFFIFMLIYNKKEVLNNSRDLSFREDWDLPKKDKDKGF